MISVALIATGLELFFLEIYFKLKRVPHNVLLY